MKLNYSDRSVTLETRECYCQNGKIAGKKPCGKCHGTGRTKGGLGKGSCTQCHGYKTQPDFVNLVTCIRCKGTCLVPETETDYIPKDWLGRLPIKVFRSNRQMTLAEQHLGAGLYSCVDYGAHQKLTDEQIITTVTEHSSSTQLCKVYTREKGFATGLAVICGDQGYSVIPTWSI